MCQCHLKKEGWYHLHSSIESAIACSVTMNSSIVLDRIIKESAVFARLCQIGLRFNKCTLIRCAIAALLEDLQVIKDNDQVIEIIRRCGNRISTHVLLSEMYDDLVPDHKHKINPRRSKSMTSISTGLTPSTIRTIDKLVSSRIILEIFERLEERGYIPNSKSTIQSILVRDIVCYILTRIGYLERYPRHYPRHYQRVVNKKTAEFALEEIYHQRYDPSNKLSDLSNGRQEL